MRILWVEDSDQLPQELINQWFGEFYAQHQIERHNGFSDAYRCIQTQPQNYDCVILDINLENSEFNPQEFTESDIIFPKEKEKFLKESGFHLYIRLLYKGFPTQRMVFLTGNASEHNASEHDNSRVKLVNVFKQARDGDDEKAYVNCVKEIREKLPAPERKKFNDLLQTPHVEQLDVWLEQWATPFHTIGEPPKTDTYKELHDRFYEARMTLPRRIEKNAETAKTLQDWLHEHCSPQSQQRQTFDYLTLRRGMLDAIEAISRDDSIQCTADFENDLDKAAFLSGLAWQVRDFALPPTDYDKSYLAVCEYLSKPFERYFWKKNNNSKNSKDLLNESDRHLKMPLYFLRNWIAHGLIAGSNTTITAQAAGLVFLLAMRHFFSVENYGFQNELQRLFARPMTDPQEWNNCCTRLKQKFDKSGFSPLESLKEIGHKTSAGWEQQDFIQHFYAAYVLCLQQVDGSVLNAPFNGWIVGEISQ